MQWYRFKYSVVRAILKFDLVYTFKLLGRVVEKFMNRLWVCHYPKTCNLNYYDFNILLLLVDNSNMKCHPNSQFKIY